MSQWVPVESDDIGKGTGKGKGMGKKPLASKVTDSWNWNGSVEFDENKWELNVYLEGWGISDADIKSWCSWFLVQLKTRTRKWEEITASQVNVAQNSLTSEGIDALLDTLSKTWVQVRNLKLQHNNIEKANGIAKFIRDSKGAVSQLHLSHNDLSTSGVSEIVKAIASVTGDDGWHCYPGSIPGSMGPLWARFEHNYVDVQVLQQLSVPGRSSETIICKAVGKGCTPDHCKWAGKNSPALHARFLASQKPQIPEETAAKQSHGTKQKSKKAEDRSVAEQEDSQISKTNKWSADKAGPKVHNEGSEKWHYAGEQWDWRGQEWVEDIRKTEEKEADDSKCVASASKHWMPQLRERKYPAGGLPPTTKVDKSASSYQETHQSRTHDTWMSDTWKPQLSSPSKPIPPPSSLSKPVPLGRNGPRESPLGASHGIWKKVPPPPPGPPPMDASSADPRNSEDVFADKQWKQKDQDAPKPPPPHPPPYQYTRDPKPQSQQQSKLPAEAPAATVAKEPLGLSNQEARPKSSPPPPPGPNPDMQDGNAASLGAKTSAPTADGKRKSNPEAVAISCGTNQSNPEETPERPLHEASHEEKLLQKLLQGRAFKTMSIGDNAGPRDDTRAPPPPPPLDPAGSFEDTSWKSSGAAASAGDEWSDYFSRIKPGASNASSDKSRSACSEPARAGLQNEQGSQRRDQHGAAAPRLAEKSQTPVAVGFAPGNWEVATPASSSSAIDVSAIAKQTVSVDDQIAKAIASVSARTVTQKVETVDDQIARAIASVSARSIAKEPATRRVSFAPNEGEQVEGVLDGVQYQ